MKTQKELKNTYKDMKFQIGVFQVRNVVSNKIFVGSSTNIQAAWNRLKSELKFGTHSNAALQKDWNSLGEENFAFEVVSELKQEENGKTIDYRDEVKQLESMFIEELQPFNDKGYNKK